MTTPAGILKYGSSHASVVAEASLLTEASVTNWGVGSAVPADTTIDTVNGMKAGTTGACNLTGHGSLTDLDVGGQFSFEIETEAISETNANVGSQGGTFANNTYVFTNRESGAVYGRTWIAADNTGNSEAHTSDTHVTWDSHSLDNGSFSEVNFSWSWGKIEVRINGRLHGISTRVTHVSNIFTELHLGSNRGVTSAGSNLTLQNYFVRKAMLSKAPITLARHPQLRNVYMFGDSLITQAEEAGAVYYQNNASDVIRAEFAKKGLYINLSVDGHSGSTVVDTGGNPLQNFRAALLANRPDNVIFQCGTNDTTGSSVDAAFETDLDDHINTILASIPGKIIIGTVPTLQTSFAFKTAQFVNNVEAVNLIIRDAPARWDTANPSDTGRVIVYDLFKHFGGETPMENVFTGQIGSLHGSDYHPSAKGQKMMGELQAATLMKAIA